MDPSNRTNNKRKVGLAKSSNIVMTLYRATKPSSRPVYAFNCKPKPIIGSDTILESQIIKPKAHDFSPMAAGKINVVVNQDQIFPHKTYKPKVALIIPDEAVDAKADKYISAVQERFRLERVNSERKTWQDIQL